MKRQILITGATIKYRDTETSSYPTWSVLSGGGGSGGGAWGEITGILSDQTDLQTELDTKVDKITGKSLSENDFTTILKNTYDSAASVAHNHTNKSALDLVSGTNTGDQDLSGLQPKETGKGLSTNDLTNTLKSNYDSAYTHSQTTHAPSNAQVNVLEGVQVNGVDLNITNKKVNVDISGKVDKVINQGLIDTSITSRITYNLAEDTISYTRADGGTTEFGKEIVDTYTNIDTVDIVNGDIVSIVGATGNRSAVKLTDASDSALSLSTIGMCTVPMIQQNNSGVICKLGKVHGLNTIDYAEGTMLYVSPIFKGKWTSVKPASGYIIQIGVVVVSHTTQGVVDLHVQVIPQAVDIITDSTHRFVTDTEKSTWGGKQDALGFTPVPNTRQVNGYALSADVTITKSDVGLGNVSNTDTTNPSNIIQDSTHRFVTDTDKSTWGAKQDALSSGTNIKTINGNSILGSGDITISAGGAGSDTTAIHKDASNEYSSVTEKTALAGDDIALIEDSESSFSKKKWRLSSIKTYLQTAFNTIYSLVSDQGDRHGFYNASNSSLSFDNTTRTFTITPTSQYIIYINGSKYNITADKVVSFANTACQWFITFSISSGIPVLNATQTPWSLLDLTQIPVAIISWNGVSGRILDERHSSKRNLVWHDSEHNSVGARYRSGFSSITPISSNTFSLSSGVIADEDIILDAGGTQTTCQIMYRNPGLTFMTWDASSTAYVKTGANGRPVYDNSGGLTEIANNKYAVYYLTMTNCIESGKRIVSIMAQSEYASLTAAQASAIPVLLANVAEWKYLYRIIVKASANGFTYIESNPLYNLSTGLAISSGAVTSVSAAGTTLTPFDGITATNVQSGLEQINARYGRYDVVTTTSPTSGTLTLSKATKHLLSTRLTSSNSFAIALPADETAYLNESILVFSIGASLPSIIQPYFETPGTVSVTNNSNTFTGTGTLFLTYFKSGDSVRMPDGTIYTVIAVASNTSMTMTAVYAGTTVSGLILSRFAMWRSGNKPTLSTNSTWVLAYEWHTNNGVQEIYASLTPMS